MPYAEVEPDEVKARIARGEDVFLLDVREPDEVELGLPDRRQHPTGAARRAARRDARDATIVVACHVGRPLRRRGASPQRRRVDGRKPHRRGRRLGGRGNPDRVTRLKGARSAGAATWVGLPALGCGGECARESTEVGRTVSNTALRPKYFRLVGLVGIEPTTQGL